MQDRPSPVELLQAVREHLEREVIPKLGDPKLKFQTLVCANVVGIVEREIATEELFLRGEWDGLAGLLGWPEAHQPATLVELRDRTAKRTRELCAQIRAGAWDEAERRERLLEHVRRTVVAKLTVANPRYTSAPAKK